MACHNPPLKETRGNAITQPRSHPSIILLHAWLGFAASLAIIPVIHNYGKFEISFAIPK